MQLIMMLVSLTGGDICVSKIHQKQVQRRIEILEKVLHLMKTKSFEEISVQEICTTADISIGSFYHYFKQKSDILASLMELIDIYMLEHVFPLLTNASALENLKLISRGFAAHIVENGIELSKLISRCCPTEYNIYNEKRPLVQKLAEIVSTGQQKGEFTTLLSPEKTADLLLIALSGVAVDWSRRDGNYSILDRMEEFSALFLPALTCKRSNER